MLMLAAGKLTYMEITQLFLGVGVLLIFARVLGEAARRIGQPSILGEIAAGIILGPTILGIVLGWTEGTAAGGALNPGVLEFLFPTEGNAAIALETLIALAVALLLLVAGLEVDLSTVWKQGTTTIFVSIAGMVIPFAFGFGLGWMAPDWLGQDDPEMRLALALFIGIALSITALPVIAKILMDLNMSKSDFGVLVISSAMINDLVGWIGFAVVLAMTETGQAAAAAVSDAADTLTEAANQAMQNGGDGGGGGDVAITIFWTLLFVGGMLTVGRWALSRALVAVQGRWEWPGGVLAFVFSMAFFGAALTEYIGIHSIFGAFIVGVAIGDSPHLRQRTRETIHEIITSVFAPLFFCSIGLHVNFIEGFNVGMVAVVLAVAIGGKIIGCYLGAKLAKMSSRESWAVGFAMTARGAMEIILGKLALNHGLIEQELFIAIVIMALVTSMIAGPAIQRILQRKSQKKLSEILGEKQFVPRMEARTARQAIRQLSEVAARATGLDEKDIDEAVWTREQIVHTGLAHGIAVPHARLSVLKQPYVIVGRDFEGIDFDAADGEPARLICLVLTPADDPQSQLDLLSLIAQTFESAELREQCLEAQTFAEFLAVINVVDNQNGH